MLPTQRAAGSRGARSFWTKFSWRSEAVTDLLQERTAMIMGVES